MQLLAEYYQQCDADFTLDVPGEGYGGWRKAEVEIAPEHTAVVVMHAWDTGTREQYPGWHRVVEYMPRADQIGKTVFPKLLSAVRASGFNLFHVVASIGDAYKQYPGYRRALALAGPDPAPLPQAESDPVMERLQEFRKAHVYGGEHNDADIERGFKRLDFMAEAKPQGGEGVAENTQQLFALCREAGVNHLIYAGFAINWCLLLSPGGMAEISQRGIMCSAFRQAVTAVENKETARKQLSKELALWRVALAFGFVFDVDNFIAGLNHT